MNPFYVLICGPAIIAMMGFVLLVYWAATAPHKAAQNVQRRKS